MRKAAPALAALALACAASAGAAPPPTLQQTLDRVVAAGAPGAIALVRDGRTTTRLASGLARITPKTPMSPRDRFRVGSVTKSFVATVVLQLVGEGKLALDDTVESRLPGVVKGGAGITVQQLLNMTSGLPDFLADDKTIDASLRRGEWTRVWKPQQLVALANRHAPHFAPGKGWRYSNTGYVALGMIVERVTGHPVAQELRTRVFRPLGLRDTSFDSAPRIAGRHSHGYFRDGKQLLDVSDVSPSNGWAAGAVTSTLDDVARFYRALLAGKLLPADLLGQMETVVPVPGANGYGLGLFRLRLPCGSSWGHDGGITGYRTWAMNSKDGRRQVVVFANLDEESLGTGEKAMQDVLRAGLC
jgi:D-alanyl-D-alanine carboxypeptidase